jgi:hypothetical protein
MTMIVVTLCFSYFVSLCIKMYQYQEDKYQSDTLTNFFGPGDNDFKIDSFKFLPTVEIRYSSIDSRDVFGKVTD